MEETWNTDITINTEAMAEKILICSISHIKMIDYNWNPENGRTQVGKVSRTVGGQSKV